MKNSFIILSALTLPLLAAHSQEGAVSNGLSWPTIDPAIHLQAVTGTTSADSPADFLPGGHDPQRNERLELQSLHPSLSLRWGEHLEGFVTGLLYTDAEGDFEWEWEEIFGKIKDLPGGLELRGGRFLNRIGFHNPTHLHGWDTLDTPLPNALFLGEDGLQTIGGEINWHLPVAWQSVLSLSYGEAPSHDHGHGHDHDHHHGPDLETFEELRLNDQFFTFGGRTTWQRNDFHRWSFALGAGWGENEEEGDAWFGLSGIEYGWRQNGFEPRGRELLWRTEFVYFESEMEDSHGHHDHDDHHSDFEQHDGWGLSSLLAYSLNEHVRPFARIDYVDSFGAADLPSWSRYTVGSTFFLHRDPTAYLRIQANFDERGTASEQSIWLQFGFSFGGPEVR